MPPSPLAAFNDLWQGGASRPAKITAGKKPARGCCDSSLVAQAFLPVLF
jgi:hypothetical protein